jgi:hypothetical protein
MFPSYLLDADLSFTSRASQLSPNPSSKNNRLPKLSKSFIKNTKTYNSGYSPVVTHLTTNPPVHCLSTAERTGSSIFSVLWSYVEDSNAVHHYIDNDIGGVRQWVCRIGTSSIRPQTVFEFLRALTVYACYKGYVKKVFPPPL